MVKKVTKPVTFILSTGRTGTQFFSKYLTETCDNVVCLHEPMPSRRFKWYSNYYLQGKLSKGFIAKQYLNNRKKVLRSQEIKHYVESSNFLFGCVEPVMEKFNNLSVIHIVRHPVTYTISHLNKGFWSGIKGFTAKNIPGWVEFLDPKIKKSGDPVMILFARWIYVNKTLHDYRNKTKYLNVRFEDVFAQNASQPSNELNKIRAFIGCNPLDEKQQLQWLQKSANKSRKNRSKKWPIKEKHLEYIRQQGQELLETFNYGIDQN